MDDGRLNTIITTDDVPFDKGISHFEERLDQAQQRVEEFGGSLDDSTKSLSKSVEALGKQFKEVVDDHSSVSASVEQKTSVLKAQITQTTLDIAKYREEIKSAWKDANEAFNSGDYEAFNKISEGIEATAAHIEGLTSELESYQEMMRYVETTNGLANSVDAVKAPEFFAKEEDFQKAEELRQKIADIQSQIAQLGDEEMETAAKLGTDLGNTREELQALEDVAMQAASALGTNLGQQAATASENLYECNKAIIEQLDKIDGLESELQSAVDAYNEMLASGEASKEEIVNQQMQLEILRQRLINAKTEMYNLSAAQVDLKAQYENVTETIKQSNEAKEQEGSLMVKLLGGAENYKTIMSGLPAPIKGVITSINGMTGAAKAFIATPLGAVIAALVLGLQALKKWFTASAEGQRKFAEISGTVKGILDQLGEVVLQVGKALFNAFSNPIDTLKKFGKALLDNVFNRFKALGNMIPSIGRMIEDVFKGNWDQLNDDFKDFRNNVEMMITGVDDLEGKIVKAGKATAEWSNQVVDAAKEQAAINRERFDLEKKYSDWQVKKSEEDARKRELSATMYNTTLSKADRKKALDEYKQIISEQMRIETEFADKRIELQEREMALTTNPIEAEMALNQLRADKNKVVAQLKGEIAALARRSNSILKSGSGANKEVVQAKKDAEELMSLQAQNTQAEISQMADGAAKKRAQIVFDYQQQIATVKKLEEKWKTEAANGELSEAQSYAIAKAVELAGAQMRQSTKDLLREEESAMDQYLSEYGTYEEKKLAITNEYARRIEKAETEGERLSLAKQREKALRDLEQSYNQQYSLIFANARSLSDTMLKNAIDATQEAIKNAKDSGDIQALTELYKRLREQMNVQGDRQRDWGYGSISQGFALRSSANQKRTEADKLEASIVIRERGVDRMKSLGIDESEIEAARKKIEELRAEIQKLRDDADSDDSNALGFLEKGFSEIGNVMSELGSEMSSFRDGLGGACDTIADIGEGLSAIGSKADTLQKAFSGQMSKSEAFSTIISGTIELIGMVGSSIAANKRAQEDWNRTIEEAAQKYRMLKLEALDYSQQNLFGVENPYKKALDGARQYQTAMELLREQQDKLENGQVQTGTKKAANWKNVGKGTAAGAAVGAAVGSIVPAIGTAVGTAIGAIGGAIAGLFSRKRVAVFDSLKNVYGELFDPQTYELNPKLLADYEKLDADTKQIVDNWEEIREKALEAEQQMRDNFKDIAGDIGNQLSDALVKAVRNGELDSAIDNFHDKMTSTIEDIMEQLVFSATMGAIFDELEERMMDSFGQGGDEDIVDDLIWMEQEYQKRLSQYEEAMKDVQDSLQSLGYDLWKADEEERQGATKSGITASQDSMDESNARLTTIQGHTYEINKNVLTLRQQHAALISMTGSILNHVMGIHKDTRGLNDKTDFIRTDINALRSEVSRMNTNGITIKR